MEVRPITSDSDYYQKVWSFYKGKLLFDAKLEMKFWHDVSEMFAVDPRDDKIEVLIVGPGEGALEAQILEEMLRRHPQIHARVVEPDEQASSSFGDKLSALKQTHPGLSVDFSIQTLQAFLQDRDSSKTATENYHCIVCIHCLYYVPDVSSTLQALYNSLKKGGVIGVTIMDAESTVGRINYEYVSGKLKVHPASVRNSKDIKEALQTKNWSVDYRPRPTCIDVSLLLADTWTEEADMMFDFMLQAYHFRQSAPDELVQEVVEFIKKESFEREGDMLVTSTRIDIVVHKPAE